MSFEFQLQALIMYGVGIFLAFLAGQVWESTRADREAKREAIARYKAEILKEKRG